MKIKSAFTLVELIMVLVIIGILGAVVTPMYANLRTEAIESHEDSVLGNLKEAVAHEFAHNVSQGTEVRDAWPQDNPFSYLNPTLPNKSWVGGADQTNWKYFHNPSHTSWFLYCPHYDGAQDGTGHTEGRYFIYCYGLSSPLGLRPGQWQETAQNH